MGKQGPDQFLAELIRSEDTKSVLVLSSDNLQSLIEKLEDSLERLMVIPTGDVNLQETFDMCIVLEDIEVSKTCLLYTSPSPRDGLLSRMPSSA